MTAVKTISLALALAALHGGVANAANKPGATLKADAKTLRAEFFRADNRPTSWEIRQFLSALRKFPTAQQTSADTLRAEARQQAAAEAQTAAVAVRQEFAESLKNARRQCHEHARKLAEETREVAKARQRKAEL